MLASRRRLIDELWNVVAFDEAWVVLDELLDPACEQISVFVASVDHRAGGQDSISFIVDVANDLLPLDILEAVDLGDRLVLVYQHQGHTVGLFNVPGHPVRLVAQIHN